MEFLINAVLLCSIAGLLVTWIIIKDGSDE
jgi:hypothetical protein